MTKSPKVSVAMPVYNCERYVARSVESILAQTFTDFEFLIVDDGSTDSSRTILESYAARDARIQLVSRPNTKLVVALNEMLGRARGEYVARMDADDVALPHRFERQVRYLDEHSECVLVGSRVIIIDPDGDPLAVMGNALTHEEIDQGFMMAQGGQLVYHPAVVFRRQAVLKLGGYRPEFYLSEDLDLFLRLAEIGRIVNLEEPLLMYREHVGKLGHRMRREQHTVYQRVLIEAYRRRGLAIPPDPPECFQHPKDQLAHHETWGWWALMSGHVAVARKHAWTYHRRNPLSLSAWKLLYCSLRGH